MWNAEELAQFCLRPGITFDAAMPVEKRPIAANFAADIYMQPERTVPQKILIPANYTAHAGLLPRCAAAFDGYCQYADGRLVLFQTKGADKDRSRDSSVSLSELQKTFLSKLDAFFDKAAGAARDDDEQPRFRRLVEEAREHGKLAVELCVSRRMTEATRSAIIRRAAAKGWVLWIVAPNAAQGLQPDTLVS